MKNRPEEYHRTTTSPLVVQQQFRWPVGSMALELKVRDDPSEA